MDLRMPWLSAYCYQKHCIFISSLSAESGGKGIENSKIFNFNRLKIKSTKLPNSHDRLNHRSLLDNLETVTHLTKEPHPKEGAKTFPSWTVSLWIRGKGIRIEYIVRALSRDEHRMGSDKHPVRRHPIPSASPISHSSRIVLYISQTCPQPTVKCQYGTYPWNPPPQTHVSKAF